MAVETEVEPADKTSEQHTAEAMHSALDSVLKDGTDGKAKAKKLARIMKAMHEEAAEEEEDEDKLAEDEAEVATEEQEAETVEGEGDETTELTEAEIKAKEDAARKERESRQEQLQTTVRMEQTATLAEPQIDRERGVLRHVHIAGMVSHNDGARYRIEGHRKAAPRFEQMPVGLDHDYSGSPMKVGQVWGTLSNITVEADGPYGDLTYLKSHERTEQILEDAERKTGIFSLSMVCQTRGKGLDIEEYNPSRVDLVVRGATTRTLFNQQQATPPAVSKEEHDALKARFEQQAATIKELEKRFLVFEQLDPKNTRLEQTIATTLANTAKTADGRVINLKEFWDTALKS